MSTSDVKKRGRKSKAEKEALETTGSETLVVAPKKRGRKPKGGKIVQHYVELPQPVDASPNVILHLKCSLSDADATNSDDTLDGHELQTSKSVDLGFHVINQTPTCHPCVDEQQSEEQCDGRISNKELNSKLKILQRSLHMKNVPNEGSACFWCTCGFDNPPVFIPKHQINDEFYVYGNFCSPECAAAYLMKEDIDASSKFERYQFLNYLYAKTYQYKRNIKPSPDPRYFLSKFCGNLTIHEYRTLSQNDNLLLVIDHPMTRVFPEIHEDNDDFMLGSTSIASSSTLRLKRQGTVPQSKNEILSENFGI